MALETLKDVKKIDGFEVVAAISAMGGGIHGPDAHIPVLIDHETNRITFQIQKGPIKENGVNGCQVDTIVMASLMIIEGLDKAFPCDENKAAYSHLMNAYDILKKRRSDREARGVEGLNKA